MFLKIFLNKNFVYFYFSSNICKNKNNNKKNCEKQFQKKKIYSVY